MQTLVSPPSEVFEETKLQAILANSQSRFELWKKIVRAERLESIAEIGVWKGEFARHILRQCKQVEVYYMVDPWTHLPGWNKPFNVTNEEFEQVYSEAMAKTAFAESKIRVLRGTTLDVIDQIPDGSLDFAYIDGDHSLRGITIDLVNLLPKIKPGGLIGGDDFAPRPWQHGPGFEPTLVCPFAIYFAEAKRLPIVFLPFNQFMIRNRPKLGFSVTDATGCYTDTALSQLAAGVPKAGWLARLKSALARLRVAKPPA